MSFNPYHQLPPGYPHGDFPAQTQGAYPSPQHPTPYGYSSYPGPGPLGSYPPGVQVPADGTSLGLGGQRFWTGALIGAAAAFLLTNESVQRATIKTAVKVWSLMEGGFEELKERFRDAQAEISAEEEQQQ